MGIELGRISGPLLASNLVRKGTLAGEENLAFHNISDTDNILYIDVVNSRIGIKTGAPSAGYALHVNGNTRSDDLEVPTQFETPNYVISTNRIQNLVDKIYLQPDQTTDPKITAPKIGTLNLRISDLLIENITNNSDITLEANTGRVVFNTSKVNVDGALHATGDITFDGDVTFGTDNTDNVTFSADVASSLIPDDNITWDLGSNANRWATAYITDLYVDNITVAGLNVATLESNGTTQVDGNAFLGSDSSDVITFTSTIDSDLIPTAGTYTLGNNTTPKIWKTVFLTGLVVDGKIDIRSNTVTTLTTDEALELIASGTGKIYVQYTDVGVTLDLNVDGYSTLDNVGITGLLNLPGDYTWTQTGDSNRTGNTNITGTLTLKAPNVTQFQDINVTNNIITTTVTDNDLRLVPDGTGKVHVVTTNVQITNDLDVGLYGYFGSLTVGVGITVPEFTVGDIFISNNDIVTISANRDLELSANGTGKVYAPTNDVSIANDLTVTADTTVNGATSLNNTFIGTTGAVGSAQFSGSNYLSVAGGVGTAMGTGDFTWECWVYPTASSSYQAFIDSRTSPLTGGDTTGFYFGTNFNTITPMYYTNGLQLASSIDLTLNSWNHVALTRASGTVTIWVNGSSGGIRTGDTTDLSQQRVFIGSSGLDLYLTGRITNLRIVKGTAVYTAPFTVPTTALTAIAGTQLLLLEDTSGNLLKDSSANNFTVINNSSVTWSSSSPVPGGPIPNTLTQTGNIIQTGSIDVTGNFQSGNIDVLTPSYVILPEITLQGSAITVTSTDLDLNFTANGTGGVVFDRQLKITNNVIQNIFDINDVSLSFNNLYLTEDGDFLITEDGDNYLLDLDNLRDLSLIFEPQGTGNVIIDSTKAIAIAYGNNVDRDLYAVGEIRQNSTTKLYEGWTPNGLVSFNNIYDSDRNTYITPELTPGANDNTIRFGVAGTVKGSIDATKLFNNTFQIDNVTISSNTISNSNNALDLSIVTTGTGAVSTNNLLFKDNTVTNTLDSEFILETIGSGYVKFGGTGAVVIPYGDNSQRRITPDLGETRYSTQQQYIEIFDGAAWIPASGASSAATEEEIQAETNLWAMILG
jgi:hypothetical protein